MPVEHPLRVRWDRTRSIVNLRGDTSDTGFVAAVAATVGLGLPAHRGTTVAEHPRRIVQAGPDEWWVIGEPGSELGIASALKRSAGTRHHAVTDVSSGYVVLGLSGPPVRDVLAQGCPLDLHPRHFPIGACAGTHFFKTSVLLWCVDDDGFELLVRSSFVGYVECLLESCTRECGMEML